MDLSYLALALAAALPVPIPALHHPDPSYARPAPVRDLVRIELEDESGRPLEMVRYGGGVFVAGEYGARYVIRVANQSPERLEIVVSVDGRDVVSGRLGDHAHQRGYVVGPFETLVIDGFRRSLDHVAAFRFSSREASYSARRGTPQHVGSIGVVAYRERVRRPRRYSPPPRRGASPPADASPHDRDDAAAGAGRSDARTKPAARSAPRTEQELGTAFGETRASAVREVGFIRRNSHRPDARFVLHYDSAEALRARGVPIWPDEPCSADEGWPGARDDRFAPPPPRAW